MSSKQSGSAVNELEYYGYLIKERQRAIELRDRLKELEKLKPKKIIKVNSFTYQTEGFVELMERKKNKRPIFKRSNE